MIQIRSIDAAMLREMVVAGATLLEKNREAVDALNVFPVPDGDTGTNMSLTMMSAVREITSKEFATAGQEAEALAKGALRGARGNSGVITSQLYRGFSRALEGTETISPMQFAQALKRGAETAYKAVMKPKEGTILTVARVVAEEAVKQAQQAPDDYDALFNVIQSSGEAILSRTQEMLPVLKQAGVVDAGGRGLLIIYAGYAAALRGEHVDDQMVDMSGDSGAKSQETVGDSFVDDHDALTEIKYTYCTNFDIQNVHPELRESDIANFRRSLNRIGDNVLVSGDLKLLHVHAHTNDPHKVLQYGLQLGELINFKIDNIAQQRREKEAEKVQEPPKDFGMVSVSLGEGFSKIFTDLSVDALVDGGQTMNPSIDDLSQAIERVNAKTVFVLPNNGNIILAAQQAAQLSEKQVFVIPTKNVAMGIAAVVSFQPNLSAEDNAARMEEAAQRVRTGTITFAVRDSEFENMHITEGDIIGLHNGKVSFKADNVHDVAMQLMDALVTEDDGLITIYYGADTSKEDADQLGAEIAAKYGDCDVEVHLGGQPLYYYLISVE